MSNILTEREKLMITRSSLILENFNKEFNKIKRINESNGQKNWTEKIILENGVSYTVYLKAFKLFTSDRIDRYSIYIKNNNLTEKDTMTLFSLVASNHPTLNVSKINHHGGMQTELIISSTDDTIHHK